MNLRNLILLVAMSFSGILAYGQTTTNYGSNSGSAGYYNSNYGYYAAYNSTSSCSYNTAIGPYSLYGNTSGDANIAIGHYALRYNTTGSHNVATGYRSMYNLSTGTYNTGLGSYAVNGNSSGLTGSYNVGLGYRALYNVSSGDNNVGIGYNSLESVTTGSDNIGIGEDALSNNTNGFRNTALGSESLKNNNGGVYNTGVGFGAGASATSYSYSTAIGEYAYYTASSQVRIGNNLVNSIGGYQNWTNLSDGRFKRDVQEDVLGLDFVNNLRPVSYYVDNDAVTEFLGIEYPKDHKLDKSKKYQTGFIAQEVEATAQALGFENFGGVDAPANENSHYGLRYAEFVVPLVKSVQELSNQNDEQQAALEELTELKELVAKQQAQIDELLGQQGTSSTTNASTSTARMEQNQPNPFSEATNIRIFLPETTTQAYVMISNLEGKQLEMIAVEQRGEATITLEANKLSPGLYLYTLVADNDIVDSKKMLIIE